MRKTLAGLFATGTLLGGGAVARDVSTLDVAPIERVEIIAGERVEAKQIENTVEATFPWKDQPGIKVKYDMGEPTVEEKAKDVRKKQVLTETVTDFEGGFKVDIILSERPDTNRFCYTIEGAENYDFFYQPPLTEEEILEGTSRPPEIEGSYAVYHKVLKNHIIGRENYATGKVLHIPRPQVWEVDNKEATTQWAELSYENGELCVTASQDFLDKAKYPVRIDPTFGYTSIGATASSAFEDNLALSRYLTNVPMTAEVDSISFYIDTFSSTGGARVALYTGYDRTIVANSEGAEISINTTEQWRTHTYSGTKPVVTPQTYWIGLWQASGASFVQIYSDTGSNGNSDDDPIAYHATNNFPSPPQIVGLRTTSILSLYATYTATTDAPGIYNNYYTAPGSYVWTAPTGVTSVNAACWGGGGGGGVINLSAGGGGGGGAFASSTVAVTAGQNYNIVVGAGGVTDSLTHGEASTFATTTVVADGGESTSGSGATTGGTLADSTGTVEFAGGNGGAGDGSNDAGGGGGGAAGPNGAGVAGGGGTTVGGTGGTGSNSLGGAGGTGGNGVFGGHGTTSALGGGGGGGGDDGLRGGFAGEPGGGSGGGEVTGAGNGAAGRCLLTYTIPGGGGGDPSATSTPYILWFD